MNRFNGGSARVLVTGGRRVGGPSDTAIIRGELDFAHALAEKLGYSSLAVVEGGATGADQIARRWVDDRRVAPGIGLPVVSESHPISAADWAGDGKAAGGLRNAHMVATGANLCLAFPARVGPSSDTEDCVRRARIACIPTRIWATPEFSMSLVDMNPWEATEL